MPCVREEPMRPLLTDAASRSMEVIERASQHQSLDVLAKSCQPRDHCSDDEPVSFPTHQKRSGPGRPAPGAAHERHAVSLRLKSEPAHLRRDQEDASWAQTWAQVRWNEQRDPARPLSVGGTHSMYACVPRSKQPVPNLCSSSGICHVPSLVATPAPKQVSTV
jgi:hypothetical protein